MHVLKHLRYLDEQLSWVNAVFQHVDHVIDEICLQDIFQLYLCPIQVDKIFLYCLG